MLNTLQGAMRLRGICDKKYEYCASDKKKKQTHCFSCDKSYPIKHTKANQILGAHSGAHILHILAPGSSKQEEIGNKQGYAGTQKGAEVNPEDVKVSPRDPKSRIRGNPESHPAAGKGDPPSFQPLEGKTGPPHGPVGR